MGRFILLFAVATLAVGCAAPTPSATPLLASPSPIAASTPAPTSTPSPVPAEAATVSLAPSTTPTEATPEDSPAPPLEVDFSTTPVFPSPVLVVGRTRTEAIGESGCPQIVYEPADDPAGRIAGMQGECTASPVLVSTKPVRVAAGAPLVFRAPSGWVLGAQVAFSTEPYGPFWIIEVTHVSGSSWRDAPVGSAGDGWEEIARGDGLRLDEIDGLAPVVSGDYLVSVRSQVGQTPTSWRTYDRTYYYWIRVP